MGGAGVGTIGVLCIVAIATVYLMRIAMGVLVRPVMRSL